jgi:hypothetical protein
MIGELFRSTRYDAWESQQDVAFNDKQSTGGQQRSVDCGVEEAIQVNDGQTNKTLDSPVLGYGALPG